MVEAKRWRGGGWATSCLALAALACDASSKAAPSEPAAAASASAARALPGWGAGKRFVYATELKSKVSLSGQTLMGFVLKAKLALEARQKETEVELLAHLAEASFVPENDEAKAQFEALARELAQPFAVALRDGKLSTLRLPSTYSPFAQSIARTLAAGLQLGKPRADQRGDSWTASEQDATGSYEVEYRADRADPSRLARRKLRYDSLSLGKTALGQLSAKIAPEVRESRGSVKLGSGAEAPQLLLVDYSEQVKMQLTPTSLVDSATALRLDYLRSEAAGTQDWSLLLAGTRKLAADELPAGGVPTVNYDATRIGDYTFEKAVLELETQARDPERNQLLESVRDQPFAPEGLKQREAKLAQQGKAFTALAALLRSDAKNLPLAVARVRGRSPALRGVLDALAAAGTPEAQAALVGLMDDASLALPVRQAAAFSLTRTELASPSSVRALAAHIDAPGPLKVHALYGLGTIARRLRDAGEAARAEQVVQSLVAALGKAASPSEQVDVLRAIANSGGASAFEQVKPLLDAKQVKVQAAAIDAMRLMARPEVDPIIAARLAQAEPELQNAALDAISVRTPTAPLATALEQAAKSAAKPALRVKAVRIMGHWLTQRPELKASLEQLAKEDALEQIRQAAKSALGT